MADPPPGVRSQGRDLGAVLGLVVIGAVSFAALRRGDSVVPPLALIIAPMLAAALSPVRTTMLMAAASSTVGIPLLAAVQEERGWALISRSSVLLIGSAVAIVTATIRVRSEAAADAARRVAIRYEIEHRAGLAARELARRLDALLDSAPLGFAILDADARYVMINDRLATLNGLPAEAHVGRSVEEVLDTEVATRVRSHLREVMRTGETVVDDGPAPTTSRPWLITYFPFRGEDGAVEGAGVAVVDLAERVELEAQLRSERDRWGALVRSLQDGVFIADSSGEIVEVNEAWETITGYPRDESVGMGPPYPFLVSSSDEDGVNPLASELSDPSGDELEVEIRRRDGSRRTALVTLGARRDERGDVVEIIGSVKDITDRKVAEERARAQGELASAVASLAGVEEVADAALSFLGELVGAEFGLLALGSAKAESIDVIAIRGLQELPDDDARVDLEEWVSAAIRSRRPLVLRLADDPRAVPANLWRRLGARVIVQLPMSADLAPGVVCLGFRSSRPWAAEDVAALDELARVVERAIERARRFDFERSVASTLQHSLLSASAVPTDAVYVSRYRPAMSELEVGGDWFDVVALDAGRTAVMVGDVVGRGLKAAAVMGQLRSALTAAVLETAQPHDALRLLDRFSERVPEALGSAATVAVVDPVAQVVEVGRAGQPPPLVVDAYGTARVAGESSGPPIAMSGGRPRGSSVSDFPPGSLLVLYSDGLVERRGEPLDRGLLRLASAVTRRWWLPTERLVGSLTAELLPAGGGRDDVAVVLLRTIGMSPRVLVEVLQGDPSQLAESRQRTRPWLSALPWRRDHDLDDVLLSVGEALANAIEHAYSGRPGGAVWLECGWGDEELVVTVTDHGEWRNPSLSPDRRRGRGIRLMRALMDNVEIRSNETGTVVALTKRLRPSSPPSR